MTRRFGLLLLLVCFLTGWGCASQTTAEQMRSPMKFYYKTMEENYIGGQSATGYEVREISGHESDYLWVLTQYFEGPVSSDLTAPFQKATSILSAELSDSQLCLMVSQELGQLSQVDLTVACTCITLTCLEFPEVESVSIRAENGMLSGKSELLFNRDSFLLEDTGASLISATYTLYFSDTENRYLIGEEISVDREQENMPAYLIERLIQGPRESGLAETMPLGTALLGLEVSDGICAVDLSQEFLEHAPQTALAQRMTILSLTNTLTQLDTIDALVLYAGGQPLSRYGSVDLSQPMTYEGGAIGPVRTGLNEFDANLYVVAGDSMLLTCLPARIYQTANEAPVELVLKALFAYSDQNGYHNPIPAGTSLRSVHREDEQYVVDLSSEFLSDGQTDTLLLAVRAVTATVLGLGDSSTVRITVDGATPSEEYGTLFSAQSWDDAWFTN